MIAGSWARHDGVVPVSSGLLIHLPLWNSEIGFAADFWQ